MVKSQLMCMSLSTQLLAEITHRKHIMIDELAFSDLHLMICAPHDTNCRAICCARFMVCSRHMTFVRSNNTERVWVTLDRTLASKQLCVRDSGVVSRSLRMFTVCREHQRM